MMNKSIFQIPILFTVLLMAWACGDSPKVIQAEDSGGNSSSSTEQSTGIFSGSPENSKEMPVRAEGAPPVSKDVHTVVIKESLPTDKYVYLQVEEDGETYWIATVKQDVEVGQTYFFKEGLLKTNFESKEYNRVFDRIYLVSNIVPANHGGSGGMHEHPTSSTSTSEETPDSESPSKIKVEGSLPIAELVENAEEYAGKVVQLSGRCTKVNPNIMGRNWIHLKDGSKDDYDLVLTSQEAIPEGAIVTMKGTVTLDKDFGAGYRYDIIIENAELVK